MQSHVRSEALCNRAEFAFLVEPAPCKLLLSGVHLSQVFVNTYLNLKVIIPSKNWHFHLLIVDAMKRKWQDWFARKGMACVAWCHILTIKSVQYLQCYTQIVACRSNLQGFTLCFAVCKLDMLFDNVGKGLAYALVKMSVYNAKSFTWGGPQVLRGLLKL